MSCPLIDVYRWECLNRGGIQSLRIFWPEDLLSIPGSRSVPNLEGDIELKPGKQFSTIRFDRPTGQYSEELRGNDQGDYYIRSVSFDMRRLRVQISELRRRLMNRRVHMLFTDNNGESYFYPDMRLRRARADGARPGGRNHTSFTFNGSSSAPSFFLNGSLVDDLPQDDKIVIRSTTGVLYCLRIGACGELLTIPVQEGNPIDDLMIENWIATIGPDGELETAENP